MHQSLINSLTVGKSLVKVQSLSCVRQFALERNPMNALNVGKLTVSIVF